VQVLISIQGLILIEQPYFNEPAYDIERFTEEGERNSRRLVVGIVWSCVLSHSDHTAHVRVTPCCMFCVD
jgi:hypothetical protein